MNKRMDILKQTPFEIAMFKLFPEVCFLHTIINTIKYCYG